MNSLNLSFAAKRAFEEDIKRRAAAKLRARLNSPDNTAQINAVLAVLPEPYPLQREIIEHPAKRKVINAGRRAGKTQLAAILAAREFLTGRKVLLTSTSQDQADIFWQRIKHWLAPLIDKGMYKNETKRLLQFGEGRLRVKTGSDADVLRGEDADLLILDECSRLDPAAWYEVGLPMLTDRDGAAVFISTPNRKNWFYQLFNKARSDDTGRWAAWEFASHANPFLSQTALNDLISDMTEEAYQQEILARFLEGQGQVFRNVERVATALRCNPYPGRFVLGVDTAQVEDYTVIAVLDADKRTMVDMDRFRGAAWEVYRGRIRAMSDKWQADTVVFETNAAGAPNFEALQREGLPVIGFTTTPSSKPPLIESLVLAFDRQEIAVLNDPVLVSELGAYERKVSATTGRSQYSAPEGLHDDTVMALALAWYGVTHPARIETVNASLFDEAVF